MKKTISLITICTLLFSTTFIYADNETDELNDKLEQNRQEQTDLADKIETLNSKIDDIKSKIQSSNDEIDELDTEMKSIKLEIKELEKNIQENEEALGDRLKVINSNYSIEYIQIILSSSSLSDFFNNIYMIKQVVEQDKELLQELDENKKTIENKENELELKKEKQIELKNSLQKDNEAIQEDKQDLEELRSKLVEEEDNLENEVAEIARAAELARQAEIDEMAQESSQLSESGSVISNGSWPVPGNMRISSPYGYRIHPVLNTKKMHTGIDIPASTGTPAVAIDNGTVIFSGTQGTYGKTLMIRHDDGKVSLYAHNSQLLASVGDRVTKGQAVTKIGSTGRSTGPHLHFEIRINGIHTNPMNYL